MADHPRRLHSTNNRFHADYKRNWKEHVERKSCDRFSDKQIITYQPEEEDGKILTVG
jgi:hypothetical protein